MAQKRDAFFDKDVIIGTARIKYNDNLEYNPHPHRKLIFLFQHRASMHMRRSVVKGDERYQRALANFRAANVVIVNRDLTAQNARAKWAEWSGVNVGTLDRLLMYFQLHDPALAEIDDEEDAVNALFEEDMGVDV